MTQSIKQYKPTDLESVIQIWRDATVIAHPFLTVSELDRDELLIRNKYIDKSKSWCAWENGTIIGFVSLFETRIVALFVAPKRQRHGVGRLLTEYVIKNFGPLSVEVFAENQKAVRFYNKNGFEFVREEPNPLYREHIQWLMAQKGAKT